MTSNEAFNEKTRAHLRRLNEMERRTNDERIRRLWAFWDERTPGRVDIVLKGRVHWRSNLSEELNLGVGWLRPSPYEPISEGPHIPRFSPLKEYGAGIPVQNISLEDHDLAYEELLKATRSADLMTDTLSFMTGYPLWWRPARVLNVVDGGKQPEFQKKHFRQFVALDNTEEMTGRVVDDQYMLNVYRPVLEHVCRIKNHAVQQLLVTAISWQAQANFVLGLGQYIHYFTSVELIASYLYTRLDPGVVGGAPKSQLNQKLLETLLDLNGSNYREKLEECAKMLKPTTRMMIKALGNVVGFDTAQLFSSPRNSRSLYQIRNDIAHGRVAHGDTRYIREHKEQLARFPEVTRALVLKVLSVANDLPLIEDLK